MCPTSACLFQQTPCVPKGRRIIEFPILSKYLDEEGCECCKQPLQLCNVVDEIISGSGSHLYIRCKSCTYISRIPTGKVHHDPKKRKTMPIFDVNSKIVTGE